MNDAPAGASHARLVTTTVVGPLARWEPLYCWALLTLALGAGSALAVAGVRWPDIVPVLLLTVLVLVSVNRGTLFPTEMSVTADAAMMLAAVTLFRGAAPVMGPLVVALLTGPLDLVHWRQRSFSRMAYNSGTQGLSVLVAVAVFSLAGGDTAASIGSVMLAALGASVVYVAGNCLCAFGLISLKLGLTPLVAARHAVALDAFAIPLALVGAAVGEAASAHGWWLLLMLGPLPFVPELVGSPHSHRRGVGGALLGAATGVAAAIAAGARAPGVFAAAVVAAAGVLLGVETRAGPRLEVAPLVAVVVAAPVVLACGVGAAVIAAVAAGAATLASWSAVPRSRQRAVAAAIGLAVLAATVSTLAAGAAAGAVRSASGDTLVDVGSGIAAAIVFALVVLALGARPLREAAARAAWSAPVLVVAAALAAAWHGLAAGAGWRAWDHAAAWARPGGAVLLVVGVACVLAAAAWWGSPPWPSRYLAALADRRGSRGIAHAGAAAFAVGIAVTSVVAADGARPVLALVALAVAEAAVTVALVGVRQWRFAPARRRRDIVVLGLASLSMVGLYLPLAVAADPVAPVVLALALAVALAVGRLPALLADRAAASARDRRQRMPASCKAPR